MAVKDFFKISRKTFFNPSGWLGFNEVKSNVNITVQSVKELFVVDKPTREESFQQALKRLNLTEKDVQETLQHYQYYILVFLLLGLATLAVSFYYLFHHHSLSAFLIGLGCTSLFLVQAFRFDFWSFQMKHRKLGCTLQEWWDGKIKDEDKSA